MDVDASGCLRGFTQSNADLAGTAVDQNTDAYLLQAKEAFQSIARRIEDLVGG